MTPRKPTVRTQQGRCTNELLVIMTACTRPTQVPATQNPSVERCGGHKAFSWGAIGHQWLLGEGEWAFFKNVAPGSVEHVLMESYTPKNIWSGPIGFGGFKKKYKIRWVDKRDEGPGRSWREGYYEYGQNTLCKFFKELKNDRGL